MGIEEAKKRISITKENGSTDLDISGLYLLELPIKELEEIGSQLTSLNVGYNTIGDKGAIWVANNCKNLTRLILSSPEMNFESFVYLGNQIGDVGAIAISENLKKLSHLDINNNRISDSGAMALSENLSNLSKLNISDNQIGIQGIISISQNLKNLIHLDIGSNKIQADGVEFISQNLKKLIYLDIGRNQIGDDGVKCIDKSLQNLVHLSIHDNKISSSGTRHITKTLKNLSSLDIGFNIIGAGGAKYISQNLKKLSVLDISYNEIGVEGAELISKNLKKLSKLNIRYNEITSIGVKPISQNLKNLLQLDVNHNEIGDEGAELIGQNLTNLTHLDIGFNEITAKGTAFICQGLKNLEQLNISDNRIGDAGAKYIGQNLKSLSQLDILANDIGDAGAIAISKNLKFLSHLFISSNRIGVEGAKAISQGLRNLSQLEINNNQIRTEGAKALSQNLKNLSRLDIGSNMIGTEGAIAISEDLNNLSVLDIYGNEIGTKGALAISQNLKNLSLLTISANKIGDKGAIAISQNLKNLTHLYTLDNSIGDKGAMSIIQNMRNLSVLFIGYNKIGDEGIETIYSEYKEHPHIYISLENNQPYTIPKSATGNLDALKQYFSSIEGKETVTMGALNILLLGNTYAGKSSLKEFYLREKFTPKKKSTWGIDHQIAASDLEPNLRISFWDFGGQEYFHGTHHLFIGGRNALYLILWESKYELDFAMNNENGNLCYPTTYWLGTIGHFDTEKDRFKRTILVQSKIDKPEHIRGVMPIFMTGTLNRFDLPPENLFSVSVMGASDKGGLSHKKKYEAQWQNFVTSLNELILEQRTSYVLNRNILNILGSKGLFQWRKKYGLFLRREEFFEECNKFYKGADDFILQYLEDCGEILLFNKNEDLIDKVFIDPSKLLNNIYAILNDEVKDQGGIFTIDIIKNSKNKKMLLDVMIAMDLVFESPDKSGEFIAPQFMREKELPNSLKHLRKKLNFQYSIRFPDFMPRGVVTQFIAQNGKYSVGGDYWKYGVLYNHKVNGMDVLVLVEASEENRFIKVFSEEIQGKTDALKDIFRWFAFYTVKREKKLRGDDSKYSAKQPTYFENVQNIEHLELSIDEINYITIKEITKAIDQRANSVKNTNGNYIPIPKTFYLLLNKTYLMPKKIFFSYSRYDIDQRVEFLTQFATLEKHQHIIKTWSDGEISGGDDANITIRQALIDSDIVFCLLSPEFMDNSYIWNIEMKLAKETNKVVIPITIRACDYKAFFAEFFGKEIQGYLTQKQFDQEQVGKTLKNDTIWIGSETNRGKRDEYFAFIVDQIKKIL